MDAVVVHYFQSIIGRFPFVDGLAVFFASYMPYLFVVVFLALPYTRGTFGTGSPLLRKQRRLYFVLMTVLALLIAWGIALHVIRYGYPRVRPFSEFGWTPLVAHKTSPSLPSGHATFMFTLAAAMWQLKRKWGYCFFGLAAVTGIARVYSLVHYPTDILAGALIGIATVYLVKRITRFS